MYAMTPLFHVCNNHTFQVQVPEKEGKAEEPPAKKSKQTDIQQHFGHRGSKQQEFTMDLVKTFAMANIPLSKLEEGVPFYATSPLFAFYFLKALQ